MLKKTISVLLSLMLILSCLPVTAFAGESGSEIVKRSEIESKTEQFFAEYIGEPNAEVTVDRRLIRLLKSGNPFGISASKLANELSEFVLVKAGECVNEYGSYNVVTLASGVKTVYIAVNIAAHPELYRLDRFHDAVIKLVEGQKELVSEGNVELMDYNRAAGELALHMILYGVTAPIVRFQGDQVPAIIKQLYEQAKVADLNIDESRVPASLMRMVGGFTDILYRVSYGLFR